MVGHTLAVRINKTHHHRLIQRQAGCADLAIAIHHFDVRGFIRWDDQISAIAAYEGTNGEGNYDTAEEAERYHTRAIPGTQGIYLRPGRPYEWGGVGRG